MLLRSLLTYGSNVSKEWFLKNQATGYGPRSPGLYIRVTVLQFPVRTQAAAQTPFVGPAATRIITAGACGHLRPGAFVIFICILGYGAQKEAFWCKISKFEFMERQLKTAKRTEIVRKLWKWNLAIWWLTLGLLVRKTCFRFLSWFMRMCECRYWPR